MLSKQIGRGAGAAAGRRTAGRRSVRSGNPPVSASARGRTVRSSTRSQPMTSGARRHLAQVVACGLVFVLLVAAKLLLPGKMEGINRFLVSSMEQNIDVQAVFSAVGRAFAGEEDVPGAAKEVYQAVFHPEEPNGSLGTGEALETAAVLETPELADAALDSLRPYRQEAAGASEQPESGEQASNLAYILYSQQNVPDNVSLEQAILGFAYAPPLSGTLTSNFGYREHPVQGEERFHYGVDLAADTGTAIGCFAAGTVTAVGESSSYGRYCVVAHENGYSTLYAHCSRVTASSGASVSRGEKIAEVGETGNATGPHLHFELHREGVYLNPIYYVAAV